MEVFQRHYFMILYLYLKFGWNVFPRGSAKEGGKFGGTS